MGLGGSCIEAAECQARGEHRGQRASAADRRPEHRAHGQRPQHVGPPQAERIETEERTDRLVPPIDGRLLEIPEIEIQPRAFMHFARAIHEHGLVFMQRVAQMERRQQRNDQHDQPCASPARIGGFAEIQLCS
jgi:hypothetical protein